MRAPMIKDSKGFCGVAGGLFVLLAITPWAAKIDGKQPSPPLHGAFAQDLTIADSKVLLDVAVRGAAVAFSWDGKKLAYAHRPKPIGAPGPNSSAHKLVVVSLPQGGLLQEFSFDREISGVAWSPNNTQILVLGQFRSGRNCTIVDLTSGRLLPIGNHVITGNEPYWSEPEQVYFFERQEPADGPPLAGTIQGFHTLSLESLRASWSGDAQKAKAKAAELRQALSVRAPQAFKLLRDGGMTASLSAANLDGTYVRILANHGHGNEGIRNIWSAPDAQFAVTESGNGRLHLFKIGTRARPNLKISASWLQV